MAYLKVLSIYCIAQNSGKAHYFGDLLIMKFWQGKLLAILQNARSLNVLYVTNHCHSITGSGKEGFFFIEWKKRQLRHADKWQHQISSINRIKKYWLSKMMENPIQFAKLPTVFPCQQFVLYSSYIYDQEKLLQWSVVIPWIAHCTWVTRYVQYIGFAVQQCYYGKVAIVC